MDLIERLRPKWRHPDPEVRAAAARELGAEHQDRFEGLARTDPDARVRRIAIKKLADAALLDALAHDDGDPALRELAAERARELRVAVACSDRPPAEREAALAHLTDERSLASVAATAADEGIRRAALARIDGDRVLRDVVRNAADPAIRRDALARIRDAGVLRSIAVGDAPAELALAALEHIGDADILRGIAEHRGASKAVRQRARALLPAGAEDAPAVGFKEARARQLALCTVVEGLTAEPDVMRAADGLREAQREWDDLAHHVEPREDVAQRFAHACAAILDDAGSLTRRQVAADQMKKAIEDGVATRRALCERVEALDGPSARRELERARTAWAELAPIADGRAAALARRFAEAADACVARHEQWRAGASLHAQLDAVVGEAEAMAEATPLEPPKAWHALARRWTSLPRPGAAEEEAIAALERRFAEAGRRLEQRRADTDAHRAEERQQNLARLEKLHARLLETATADAVKPSTARRELQAAEGALADLGPLPPSERRAAWVERLSDARDQLLRRVRQEEETEEWRRWANVSAQEEIIRRVEALLEANDLAEGTRQLGRLQDEWAAVASASADKSQALWERFRAARNELRKRCDAYMAENLEKKRALCAQVADVGDATGWNETAELIKRVQAEWKQIGPVPGRHAQPLWQQLREPCDRFFARRKEHFDRVDGERREVVQKKTALCEQAEALADSTDWEATTAAMKRLQAEWKTSGALSRAQGDALWQRFRGACDRFFDRRNRREEIAREAVMAKAQALCDDLDALATSLGAETPPPAEQVGQQVDAAWAEWLKLDLGTSAGVRLLDERLRGACERIAAALPESLRGTRLDPETTRKRREKLCTRLEELVGTPAEAPRQKSLQEMALALRDRLATNTIAGGTGGGATRRQDVAREVERIAASWAHLGPALDDDARALAARFDQARARLAERSG